MAASVQRLGRASIIITLLTIGAIMLLSACIYTQVDSPAQPIPGNSITDTPLPTATDLPVTNTPIPSATLDEPVDTAIPFDEEPSATVTLALAQPNTAVAQVDGNIDAFSLTATAVLLELTLTQETNETATAIGLGIGVTQVIPDANQTAFPDLNIDVTATPGIVSPTTPGSNCVHVVVRGDNLFRLSLRYGPSVADLAAASGIANANLIFPGQDIIIPGCGTTGVVPPPTLQPTASLNTRHDRYDRHDD